MVPAIRLFAWDSGLGLKISRRSAYTIVAVRPPPPATPPPLPTYAYLVATFTPVPENVLTVVALQSTATAVAETIGTYTPVPPFITPTPFPQNLATVQVAARLAGLPAVVEETPVPANEATETALAEYATAVALTTGTFTPVPTQYVTPMVIPAFAASSQRRHRRGAHCRGDRGSASRRADIYAAALQRCHRRVRDRHANAAEYGDRRRAGAGCDGQRRGLRPGDATPFHWLVITPTPEPLPTSTPTTPPLIMAEDFTPTPIPTATEFIPAALPDQYKNLIFFQRGTGPGAQTYIFDPTTEQIGLITRQWIYPLARQKPDVVARWSAGGFCEARCRRRRTDSCAIRGLGSLASIDGVWARQL